MPVMTGDLSRKVLPVRERMAVQEAWLRERLATVLPQVMKRAGLDMWVVMTDEYNEDPVTKTLLPPTLMNARAKMILVYILLPDGTVEAQSISKPAGIEHIYLNRWYGITDTDWKGKKMTPPQNTALEFLRDLVERHQPDTIGINTDPDYPYCDGLTHANYMALEKALGPYAARLRPARELSIGWMETRCAGEIAAYDGIVQLAHGIIAECFSSNVVTPGVTTVEDVQYYLTQRIVDLGMASSFEASAAVFRNGDPGMHNEGYTIQPGDILHCDMGIDYMGLCTDTQQLAYILKPGETRAPEGLCKAMETGNRLQDIVCSKFALGKTGNLILEEARKQAEEEGITPCVYSHPLGVFAHAPGPTIGYFGNQGPTEHGSLPVHADTAYSLELNVTVPIPEWGGQPLMTCIETDIFFDGTSVFYLAERQTELILIR